MTEAAVGVVGAGVIGSSLAHTLARAAYKVILVDLEDSILERAAQAILDETRIIRLSRSSLPAVQSEVVLSRITFTTQLAALRDVSFVVESVTEHAATKLELLERLDEIAPRNCLLASSTSAIPVALMASATTRPGNVLGIHFMNPVWMIPMVEVIRGPQTTAETLRRACDLLASLNKDWRIVRDAPGFVINRVLMLAVNEAIREVEEGLAGPEEIDGLFQGCLGHKMGPLKTADLIGLDTVWRTLTVLHEHLGERFAPAGLLTAMVERGALGRKSGGGFFTYPIGRQTTE